MVNYSTSYVTAASIHSRMMELLKGSIKSIARKLGQHIVHPKRFRHGGKVFFPGAFVTAWKL